MKITVQRKVEIWVEDIYNVEDESQVQNAIDYEIDSVKSNVLWETQEDLGPVEVYNEDWKLIYNTENE